MLPRRVATLKKQRRAKRKRQSSERLASLKGRYGRVEGRPQTCPPHNHSETQIQTQTHTPQGPSFLGPIPTPTHTHTHTHTRSFSRGPCPALPQALSPGDADTNPRAFVKKQTNRAPCVQAPSPGKRAQGPSLCLFFQGLTCVEHSSSPAPPGALRKPCGWLSQAAAKPQACSHRTSSKASFTAGHSGPCCEHPAPHSALPT